MSEKLRATVDAINIQIKTSLNVTADKTDPGGIAGKISELASLIASSAEAVAISEMIYNIKIGDLMEDSKFAALNATERKLIFQGKAHKEIALMTYTERLNKGITHAIDGYRSILSFAKSEMENLRNI